MALTPEKILNDPSASTWLKDALRAALNRDVVDAANDAAILTDCLMLRVRSTIGRDLCSA